MKKNNFKKGDYVEVIIPKDISKKKLTSRMLELEGHKGKIIYFTYDWGDDQILYWIEGLEGALWGNWIKKVKKI